MNLINKFTMEWVEKTRKLQLPEINSKTSAEIIVYKTISTSNHSNVNKQYIIVLFKWINWCSWRPIWYWLQFIEIRLFSVNANDSHTHLLTHIHTPQRIRTQLVSNLNSGKWNSYETTFWRYIHTSILKHCALHFMVCFFRFC